MSKIVLIFGAGASINSGAPLMNNFIEIGKGLYDSNHQGINKEAFELVNRARGELQKASSKSNLDIHNIEDFFTAFELAKIFRKLGDLNNEQINNLPNAMKTFIIQTIEQSIIYNTENGYIKPRQEYLSVGNYIHKLINKRKIKDYSDISIISFNYDLNLELALSYLNIPFDYCLDDQATQKPIVKVLKLHGSMNWELENTTNHLTEKISAKQILSNQQMLRASEMPIVLSPLISNQFIVPPSWNKLFHYKNLEIVWRHACSTLEDSENIFIFGYSFPKSDILFRYLYAIGTISLSIIKNFTVIDPSSNLAPLLQELLGYTVYQKTRIVNKKFEDLNKDFFTENHFPNI